MVAFTGPPQHTVVCVLVVAYIHFPGSVRDPLGWYKVGPGSPRAPGGTWVGPLAKIGGPEPELWNPGSSVLCRTDLKQVKDLLKRADSVSGLTPEISGNDIPVYVL